MMYLFTVLPVKLTHCLILKLIVCPFELQAGLVMSVTAVLSVNMGTASMLLSVFFVSGALAACSKRSYLFITAPQKMEALSGSCLLIPCTFRATLEQEFDSRETFGVWIKTDSRFDIDPNNVIFSSSRTDNIYPMRFTGNLREKNCTTLFSNLTTNYTDTYYFRVENKPFMGTAYCDPLKITVQDSPPSPRIEISGDLKEKESVSITCSAFTPCPHSPPKLTWNLQQDSHNKIQENTDGTFTTKIQKTITLSDQHDGYNITCSVTYPVNEGKHVKTAEQRKTLSVSCKTTRVCYWILSVYCVATNDLGNQSSVIHLGKDKLELGEENSELHSINYPEFGVSVCVTVKILGIVLLCSTLIIFECWFRSRCCNKPEKDAVEADDVNRVIEIQAS
ncbi:sialic acid-binding Ig-like lectin 7 isoform X1 [Larimichthys crocea]|uniref:sialic acid-binding Ig-like lectin 7 isoform X1 n=2 Tax=Larimichthys crocea TaxID=215358 RepID=UPI000F5DF7A9|nr:sialic acid-binding Ig-like lectin 7 isoform X1 [Larimichthys crocea]